MNQHIFYENSFSHTHTADGDDDIFYKIIILLLSVKKRRQRSCIFENENRVTEKLIASCSLGNKSWNEKEISERNQSLVMDRIGYGLCPDFDWWDHSIDG